MWLFSHSTPMNDNSTRHFSSLDGLRGVAALMVVLYHLFEAVAFAGGKAEQDLYHGYLAVDFFFILSGFVMGNAYDRLWQRDDSRRLTLKTFICKRLIRLHPMIVLGAVIGFAVYMLQGCTQWDGTAICWQKTAVALLLSLVLLPCPTNIDPRGNTEAFPLNGPHWSVFFEYIGSLVYGIFLRRASTKKVACWVVIAGILLTVNAIYSPEGYACGWSSRVPNLLGGLLRIGFAYPIGLLIARLQRNRITNKRLPYSFLICSIMLCLLLSMPNIKGFNIAYEIICVGVFFPLIVWLGAGSEPKRDDICNTLGRLSYPLYAIHYPFIYLYIGWINAGIHPFGEGWWCTPLVITILVVILAWLAERYYERPIRQWLTKKMSRKE